MHIFINSYGTSLRVRDGLLSIKRDQDIQRVPMGKITKIFVTKSVHLSSDVLYTCLEHGVDFVCTERNGQPVGRLWNHRFGSISALRKKQLSYSMSRHTTAWIVEHLQTKLEQQKALLECLYAIDEPYTEYIQQTIDKLHKAHDRLSDIEGLLIREVGPQLRAIEGQAARAYFGCVSKHLPTAYQFTKRTRRPARDITNAMLNYAYGILYSHVESALTKAGLDPYIGFFHRDEYNRPALAYDVIEAFRPWADWVVVHLCLNEVFEDTYFDQQDGAYWLAGDAKRILIQHFIDFFEEVVEYEGKRYTRFTHIDRLATDLAREVDTKID